MPSTHSQSSIVAALSLLALALASGCTVTTEPSKTDGNGSSSSASTAGGKAACEKAIDWSNTETDVCASCAQSSCAPEIRALQDVASSCENQYSAASECRSCNCVDNAITNKALCQGPWDAYVSCLASKCESPCK